MRLKVLWWILLAAPFVLCAQQPATKQEPQPELQPFVVNHELRTDSDADVRFLLSAPAGKQGFITAAGGHLVTPDGKRFRMWGVNMTGWTVGSALLPSKHDTEIAARSLAQLGINCVRFQFLDLTKQQQRSPGNAPITYSPSGLLDGNADTSQVMDRDQFDRFDYLVSQLKANGIYVDLNLNVGRRYKKGDNVHDYDLIGVAKAITQFDPRLIELEKDYARQLLTHLNPYTKTEYRSEPAIAIVEIVNENSVLEFWQRNWFRGKLVHGAPAFQLDLTPYHKALLTGLYNGWLKKTYSAAELGHLRSLAGVRADEPFPLTQRQDFSNTPKEIFYAEAGFYTHVETSFLEEMRSYLKQTLEVKSLIIGTNDHTYFIPGMPLLRSTSRLDIVDAHVYWQHPAITGRRNTPMVNDPLHSMAVKLTRSTVANKPFTVSEVNEPFPNDYQAEMIPILAAYGAFQDWDGIFIYTFEPKVSGSWEAAVGDHFDLAEDPVKIAQMPVGALLFLRHDVEAARKTIERSYSTEQINESLRLPESESPYYTPGFPLSLPLEHGSRIRCLDCEPTERFQDEPENPIRSDTGQLAWWRSESMGGLVTIDTDKTTALVGFVRDNGEGTSHLAADVQNKFCALTVSSLDTRPISQASLLLVTATGRVENTGAVWNARRTMLEVWGTAPTRIEVVKGWLLLKQLDGAVGVVVSPLDGSGKPLTEVRGRRLEGGWEIPVGDQVATSYLVRVVR
jgi:hypothetical protein